MSRPPIVADTSPLITLSGVGQLDLIPRLYGAVSIPRQVFIEFKYGALPTDPDLETLAWLSIVDGVVLDPTLPRGLGLGESAAISLAVAVSARFVLIDEVRARNVARSKGLHVAGTLAVLLRAKRYSFIPAIRPVLATLQSQGRRFSPPLLADVLRQAGESFLYLRRCGQNSWRVTHSPDRQAARPGRRRSAKGRTDPTRTQARHDVRRLLCCRSAG